MQSYWLSVDIFWDINFSIRVKNRGRRAAQESERERGASVYWTCDHKQTIKVNFLTAALNWKWLIESPSYAWISVCRAVSRSLCVSRLCAACFIFVINDESAAAASSAPSERNRGAQFNVPAAAIRESLKRSDFVWFLITCENEIRRPPHYSSKFKWSYRPCMTHLHNYTAPPDHRQTSCVRLLCPMQTHRVAPIPKRIINFSISRWETP